MRETKGSTDRCASAAKLVRGSYDRGWRSERVRSRLAIGLARRPERRSRTLAFTRRRADGLPLALDYHATNFTLNVALPAIGLQSCNGGSYRASRAIETATRSSDELPVLCAT